MGPDEAKAAVPRAQSKQAMRAIKQLSTALRRANQAEEACPRTFVW